MNSTQLKNILFKLTLVVSPLVKLKILLDTVTRIYEKYKKERY